MKLYQTFIENCQSYSEYLSMLFSDDYEEIEIQDPIKNAFVTDGYEALITNQLDKTKFKNNYNGIIKLISSFENERYCYVAVKEGNVKSVLFDQWQVENRESLMSIEEAKIDAISWEVAEGLEIELYKDRLLHPIKFYKIESKYFSDEIASYEDILEIFEDDAKAKQIFNLLNKLESEALQTIDFDAIVYKKQLNEELEQENEEEWERE